MSKILSSQIPIPVFKEGGFPRVNNKRLNSVYPSFAQNDHIKTS